MRIESVASTQTKRIEPLNPHDGQKPNFDKNQYKDDKNQKQDLQNAVELINETVKMVDKKFEFQLHEGTNRTMVKVIDKDTEDIIREIPPEEILDLVEKMTEMVGLMMDKRV